MNSKSYNEVTKLTKRQRKKKSKKTILSACIKIEEYSKEIYDLLHEMDCSHQYDGDASYCVCLRVGRILNEIDKIKKL